jgi:hypothetical protein
LNGVWLSGDWFYRRLLRAIKCVWQEGYQGRGGNVKSMLVNVGELPENESIYQCGEL